MDFNNTTHSGLDKDENGALKIDEKVVSLQDLHIEYEAALREVKRIKKAFEKKRTSMKYLNTPVISDSEI